MKLRIRGNSLRLRLGQQEVAQFAETGEVTDRIQLGPASDQHLTYALARSGDVATLRVSYRPNRITVLVPTHDALAWTSTEEVSLHGNMVVGNGESLALLVEKDFACLMPRDEDDEDAFPHPRQDEQAC